MECAVCGKQYQDNMLLDALSMREIIKVCESCAAKEKLPVVRRPSLSQLKEAERIIPYYKRVGDARGRIASSAPAKTETTLKQIVDKNYQTMVQAGKTPRPDLVDNFHWVIMMARRNRKITQEQLAREIAEPEAAIKMAEQGTMPEDSYKLVKKLESFLGVSLVKSESAKAILSSLETKPAEKQPARVLKFDREVARNLTISNLKQMKESKEEAGENNSEMEFEDDIFGEAGSEDFDGEDK